jgi:hypothetical protein
VLLDGVKILLTKPPTPEVLAGRVLKDLTGIKPEFPFDGVVTPWILYAPRLVRLGPLYIPDAVPGFETSYKYG